MSANQVLLFIIVGQNEPLYEAEIHKRGAAGNSDAVARQNYFVVHSALDLVDKSAWSTQNVSSIMYGLLMLRFKFYLSFKGSVILQMMNATLIFIYVFPHLFCFVLCCIFFCFARHQLVLPITTRCISKS